LRRIALEPVSLGHAVLSDDTLCGNNVKRRLHAVNNIHKVVLDLAVELKGLRELHDFFSDASFHACGNGAISVFLEEKSFDGLEDLGHVAHDLVGGVTVRQDIKQVSSSDEIESGESTSFAIHEVIKSFLAQCELILDILESLENIVLVAEDYSNLLCFSVLKDNLDFFVDANEFLRLLREFLLHFL